MSQFPYTEFEVHPTAAETATGTGSTVETLDFERITHGAGSMRFYLNVSAASGSSPTMTATVQGFIDGIWHPLASFSQVTTTADKETLTITGVPKKIRVSFVIGGSSPSFTFTLSGHRY